MTLQVPTASASSDWSGESVALVVLDGGAAQVHAAVIVHRDQAILHISTIEPLPLSVGRVVGVMIHGGGATDVSLALVSDSVGPTVTELRIIEARRTRPG